MKRHISLLKISSYILTNAPGRLIILFLSFFSALPGFAQEMNFITKTEPFLLERFCALPPAEKRAYLRCLENEVTHFEQTQKRINYNNENERAFKVRKEALSLKEIEPDQKEIAAYRLAVIYSQAECYPRDFRKALELFARSANESKSALGAGLIRLRYGRKQEALRLFKFSADLGEPQAAHNASVLLRASRDAADREKMEKLFRQAATGDITADSRSTFKPICGKD